VLNALLDQEFAVLAHLARLCGVILKAMGSDIILKGVAVGAVVPGFCEVAVIATNPLTA
jgi:hypothetical protein